MSGAEVRREAQRGEGGRERERERDSKSGERERERERGSICVWNPRAPVREQNRLWLGGAGKGRGRYLYDAAVVRGEGREDQDAEPVRELEEEYRRWE